MKDEIIDCIDDYSIIKTEKVGIREFYIGVKEERSSSKEYIVGTIDRKFSHLGVIQYHVDTRLNEYSDALKYYHTQILKEIDKLQKEMSNEPKEIIYRDDCHSIYDYETLKGQVIVLDSDVLLRGYQRSSHQLYLADGGFGCSPNGNGNAIYAYNLYTGKETRIEKYNVLGVIKEESTPEWVNEKLPKLEEKIRKSKKIIR